VLVFRIPTPVAGPRCGGAYDRGYERETETALRLHATLRRKTHI